MELILPNLLSESYQRIPTMLIAMEDVLCAEMISEEKFNCHFRTLAILDEGKEIVKKIQYLNPNFLLIDSELPEIRLFDIVTQFKSKGIKTKVILYATKKNTSYFNFFLDNTDIVKGFLHKGCGIEEFGNCFVEVFKGNQYISTKLNRFLQESRKREEYPLSTKNIRFSKEILSKREIQVWEQLSDGERHGFGHAFFCFYLSHVKSRAFCMLFFLSLKYNQFLMYKALS